MLTRLVVSKFYTFVAMECLHNASFMSKTRKNCFSTLSNQILDNSCQNPYIFCTCMSYIQHTDDKNDCYFPILVSTKNRMLPLTFNYRASVSMESRFSYTLQQPSDQYLVKEFFNESST